MSEAARRRASRERAAAEGKCSSCACRPARPGLRTCAKCGSFRGREYVRPEPETYEDCVRFQDAVEMDTYWGLYYGANREMV